MLRDAQTGKIYSIYSDRQFGILRQQQALPIRPMHHYFDLHAPQLTINGISFTEISAKRSDGSSSTSCSSDVYDLVVKFDIVFVINGKGFCHTAEYFDIEIGTEPDPSLFVLPAGLKILPDQKPRPESGESATF